MKTEKNRGLFLDEDGDISGVKIFKAIIGIVIFAVIIIFAWPMSCIGPSERGVRVTLGKANDEVLQPGVNFMAPFVGRIKKVNLKPHTYDLNIEIANRGAISKDLQIIGAEGKIVWSVTSDGVVQIVKKYNGTLDEIENIIKNSAYEALKTEIGKYSIYDLPAKMNEISANSLIALKSKVSAYPIDVTQFNVVNFDWSGDFDAQINKTMAAQQQVKEAEQQANIAEQNGKKLKIQAEAEAAARIAEAEGRKASAELNASAAEIEAKGIAEANRIKAQPSALEYQRALWDYEIKLERAKHLAPGVEVPMYIPLAPNGAAAVIAK